ncbi:MAG: TIGR02099 family protein [Proteobacteria bacterium]|nr:TIGR02099 family protein [Pseudomonadota bacterium]
MTNTAKHSLGFKLWIKIRGLLAIVIIILGILVGLISLILPNDKLYKQYLVSFLSQQLKKPVEIGKITGKWQGFGPKFVITDLLIKDQDEVSVQQATLSINIVKYIIPKGSTGINLGISNIAVDFIQQQSGQIILTEKNETQQSLSTKLDKILSAGTLSINNLTVNIQNSISKKINSINTNIHVQQTEDVRAFKILLDSPELADKMSIKAISSESHDFLQQAKWYIQAKNLSLHGLKELTNKNYLPKAFVDLEVWADTKNGNINKIIAQGELKNKIFQDDAEITGLAELVYSGDKKNWATELIIKDINTESISQKQINIHITRNNNIIELNADVLDIPLLKAITHTLNIPINELNNLYIKGKLTKVTIVYNIDLRRIVSGDINFQQLDLKGEFGKFSNLAGTISLHAEQIKLIIDSDSGSAELANIMRGKIEWNKLLLTAQTSMQDDDLDIKLQSIWCDCNDFILDGAARIYNTDNLFLDLTFAIYDAKVKQLYKYWPAIIWKPKVLNFLDQALVAGVVERGMISYHGFPSEHPFKHNQGSFFTISHLKNATVKYHKQWPLLKEFNAIVTTSQGLQVTSQTGKTLEANINNVLAEIKDFEKPYLSIDIAAQGRDNFLIDYLKQSPMASGLKILKEDIAITGLQKINVNLDFSLQTNNPVVIPTGKINFLDTTFKLGQFQLQQLNGAMTFDGFSLDLNDINARFLNQPVIVRGDIINQPNKETATNLMINGNYAIANFESLLGFSLPASGSAAWQFNIANKNSSQTNFTAQSNLSGIALNMPEPLYKTTVQSAPFSITCTLPCTDTNWELNYANKLATSFKFDENNNLHLNNLIFGSGQGDFGGEIDILDVDKWLEILPTTSTRSTNAKLPFQEMTIQVKKLIFMSRILHDVTIEVVNNPTEIVLNIRGKEIQGQIQIADDISKKGIVVQLDRLHWQAPNIETMAEKSSKTNSNIPALHIWIGDFIYDGIPLGEANIEIRPITQGIRVEKITTRSDLLNLNINGEWLKNQGAQGVSKFNIIITSKNIAKFLTNLGFHAPISKADTLINLQAQWHDFPSQFAIKNISGNMRVEIGKGEVIDAQPGMGRVLGLFSLTNLPRRLILDFGDVLGKGLRFNSMQGNFVLENGNAFTQGFVIDSSSAKIILSGKTGLANQDYDQTIIVEPRVGRILPTIGAIAGGPVGAAAGFLVQGIFHKGLKNIGKIIYKVTGTWDDPQIELIETHAK